MYFLVLLLLLHVLVSSVLFSCEFMSGRNIQFEFFPQCWNYRYTLKNRGLWWWNRSDGARPTPDRERWWNYRDVLALSTSLDKLEVTQFYSSGFHGHDGFLHPFSTAQIDLWNLQVCSIKRQRHWQFFRSQSYSRAEATGHKQMMKGEIPSPTSWCRVSWLSRKLWPKTYWEQDPVD